MVVFGFTRGIEIPTIPISRTSKAPPHSIAADHIAPSSTYFCPLATSARPSTLDPGDLSSYTKLETTSSEFVLSIAYAHSSCNQFRVKISRTDPTICAFAKGQVLSSDPETQAYIMNELGPDTFQLRVDGAERLVLDKPERFDASLCAYEFDFRLNTPGVVWLSGLLLFKGFGGFDEINTGSPECLPFLSPILSSKPNSFDPLLLTPAPPSSPSACTGPEPIIGTYVTSALPSILYPPEALPVGKKSLTAGVYDFVPSDCTFQHDGLRFKDHSSCLKEDRGVYFTGDSNARVMYDALLQRLEGFDSILQFSEDMPRKSANLKNLHMEFRSDSTLEYTGNVDCAFVRDFSSFVVSSGVPQTCDSASVTAYFAKLLSIFATLPILVKECLPPDAPPPVFVYLNTPAFWYPQDVGLDPFECRTPPRLEYWNKIAGKIARESGWSLVDVFSLTKPFAIETRNLDGDLCAI
ncbi:hypothetical protein RQP46_004349 [Phenoliferia psychrophenolica]